MAAVRMAVMEIGAQDVIMKVYEIAPRKGMPVSYTHLRAHETD